MGQEFTPFCEIETKEQNVDSYKSPVFLEDVDIDNILVSNKISSGEKRNKYFIGYLHDDYKINLLNIVLLKTRVYVKKIMIDKLNGCIFWLKMMTYVQMMTIWLGLILKKSLIMNLFTTEKFGKLQLNFTVIKLQIFTIKRCQ